MAIDEISIDDLKQLNESHGMNWFSTKETNSFKSTYPNSAKIYKDHAYFVTGEREDKQPRKYTVRKINLETGSVDKIGNFQEHGSQYSANQMIADTIGLEKFIELYCYKNEIQPDNGCKRSYGLTMSEAHELRIPRGFEDVPEWSDGPYRNVWINPQQWTTITYCEGDVTVMQHTDKTAYDEDIVNAEEFYNKS